MTDLPNCYRCETEPCTCADGVTLLQGDCRAVMGALPEKHFQMCVTSPPYFALRSYLPADHPDKSLEIGSETSIEDFVATMVEVFRSVWRVLRDDGVCFVNLGDSYNGSGGPGNQVGVGPTAAKAIQGTVGRRVAGLKPKDLCGIPWRVALALQADGWYLRDALIWRKPAPMPGSQRDRCTSSYEYIFQLTKRPVYYWDMSAVREPMASDGKGGLWGADRSAGATPDEYHRGAHGEEPWTGQRSVNPAGRIPRNAQQFEWDESDVRALMDYMNATPDCPNVIKMASEGFPGAHFATFPRALPEWCIKAATSEKGCCPECRTPWVRMTDSERIRTRPGKHSKSYDKTTGETVDDGMEKPWRDREEIGNRDPGRHVTATRTIGWQPGCECYGWAEGTDPRDGSKRPVMLSSIAMEPVPCKILDPFAGVSTTGLAAIALQRRCTLIELADDYCDQSVKRLRDGLYATQSKRNDLPGQRSLFDETENNQRNPK